MRGAADDRIERAVLGRLADSPTSVEDLVAAARAAAPHALERREGCFHALLHRLAKDGRVRVVGRSPRGGGVYAAGDAAPSADSTLESPPIPPPVSQTDSRVALAVASRIRDPEDRGRVVADVIAHRAALAEEGRPRAFGSLKSARDILRRVDRGRGTIVVPDTPWEAFVRVVRHEGPSILVTLAILAFVWFYVAEFRVVPSNSMQPGIKPGDRLVVLEWGAGKVPERWQVIVFRRPDDTVLVKRVVGLPGERIAIDDGDVLIDGVVATKPDALREAMREPLLRVEFNERGRADGWSRAPDGWSTYTGVLHADEPRFEDPKTGAPELVSVPRARAHDVYVTAVTKRGSEVRLRFVDGDGRVGVSDVGEVVFHRSPEGQLRVSHVSELGERHHALALLAEGRDEGDGDLSIELSIVDGVLRARGGSLRHREVLPTKRPLGDSHAEVAVRGAVSSVAIDRDVHYTQPPSAQSAVDPETPYRVPEDSLFFLGDHSAYSRDSRFTEVGAIPLRRVIGRAIFRIWPLTRVGPVR